MLKFIKQRVFIISFFSSLAAGLILFLVLSISLGSETTPHYNKVFNEYEFSKTPVYFHTETETSVEIEPEEDYVYSILTGLPIDENYVNRRPLAFIINNIRQALPQSGITSADIVYEVMAEGDVTRLIGIFQSHLPEKIGSIRSARDYFVDYAFNHDAIFIHHGGSPSGYNHIRTSQITSLDGGRLEGSVFWRDRTYPSWYTRNTGTRASEHSSYTGRLKLEEYIEENDIRFEIQDDPIFGFTFGETPEDIENLGTTNRILIPYSEGYPRSFIYNADDNTYVVHNRHGEHVDADTTEAVTVSNILIQLTRMHIISGDSAGRRSVTTVGDGTGFLINNGTYYPVRWEKTSYSAPMKWYFENGTPLILTPGKTWVCIYQHNGNLTFEV